MSFLSMDLFWWIELRDVVDFEGDSCGVLDAVLWGWVIIIRNCLRSWNVSGLTTLQTQYIWFLLLILWRLTDQDCKSFDTHLLNRTIRCMLITLWLLEVCFLNICWGSQDFLLDKCGIFFGFVTGGGHYYVVDDCLLIRLIPNRFSIHIVLNLLLVLLWLGILLHILSHSLPSSLAALGHVAHRHHGCRVFALVTGLERRER